MKKDIYIIRNDINDKVYVGQAINTKTRFQGHCKPSAALENDLVARAIQKYGREHFSVEILESQVENYNDREKYWIEYYDCICPKGYNLTPGGEEPPGHKGWEHPESMLDEVEVSFLTEDLKNTNLSFTQLAEKYGFASTTSISEFNKGKTYVRDIEYPIRKDVHNGKLSHADVDDIIETLKYTYRTFESLGKQYGVEARAISRINKGTFHKRDNETYPIREWKATSIPSALTYEQVTDIIALLLTTDLSIREIARRFGARYENILGIKNGTTKMHRRKGLTYPLRPNN